MEKLGNIRAFRDRNLVLKGADLATQRGWTGVPNFILENKELSVGAKLTYAMLLKYARELDQCFPGQARLGKGHGLRGTKHPQLVKGAGTKRDGGHQAARPGPAESLHGPLESIVLAQTTRLTGRFCRSRPAKHAALERHQMPPIKKQRLPSNKQRYSKGFRK